MKTIPAIILATLAANASATAPFYDVSISQQLCMAACADETPVFQPHFTVRGVVPAGTNQYIVNVHVEGVINYIPCGCGCCQTKSQVVSQDFTLPVYSTTAITDAEITAGATQNAMVKQACQTCTHAFVSDTPITVTFVTA